MAECAVVMPNLENVKIKLMLVEAAWEAYNRAFNPLADTAVEEEFKAEWDVYCSLVDVKNDAKDRATEILEEHQRLAESQSDKKKVETEEKQIEAILQSIQSKVDKTTATESTSERAVAETCLKLLDSLDLKMESLEIYYDGL